MILKTGLSGNTGRPSFLCRNEPGLNPAAAGMVCENWKIKFVHIRFMLPFL
jgi:hypothetical protein